MEWLGDLERWLATVVYPNRALVASIVVAVACLAIAVAWRGRWDRVVRHHPRASAAGLGVGLLLILPLAWYLGSPLLWSTTVDEPPPVALVEATPSPSPGLPPAASLDPPTVESSASTQTAPTPEPSTAIERSGSFSGADEFHFARGAARLLEVAPGEFTLRLEDFAVRNGPDLFVYLSPSRRGYADEAVELGRLKADRGNQNYRVPAGTDVTSARSVVIWCRQFGVLFGTAALP